MRKVIKLCLLFVLTACAAHATHIYSGEIEYTWLGGNTFGVKVFTYSNPPSNANQSKLLFDWGDGTQDSIVLTNVWVITPATSPQYGLQQNTYEGQHTYSGPGAYRISVQDANRVANIVNISGGNNTDQVPLYLEDSINFLGSSQWGNPNSSLITNRIAFDTAYVNMRFVHNPMATDPNGDSISYELYMPLQDHNFPATNYQWPQQVLSAAPFDSLYITPTGDLIWNRPNGTGRVNVGILMREWRVQYNAGVRTLMQVGYVKRDLHIVVATTAFHPPVIAQVHDTCVVAGTVLDIPIMATDIDPGQTISVSVSGAPFVLNQSPATYYTTSTIADTTRGMFHWQTVCDHANATPYTVYIQAYDSSPDHLSDEKSFRIKVVAPPPQNLTAVAQANSVLLNWQNPYTCSTATRFIGFSVWRRIGPNPFAIDTCTPGLAGRGYVKIADHVQAYTYTDNDVQIGEDYCYRVLAEFGTTTSLGYLLNFVESLPSNEACTQLKISLPVITNVSVRVTDPSQGKMDVSWSKPHAADLDTVTHPGPYTYKIFRSTGFAVNAPVLVRTITAPTFYQLTDTTIVDSPLNTSDTPYTYFMRFFASDTSDSLGQTAPASSVYLTIGSAGNQLTLSWQEHVPWTNTKYYIYRKYPATASYTLIATVAASPYVDKPLKNDTTYCYKVQSYGAYSATGFVNPILNWSEEHCAVPIDTTGPCPPTLTVTNACNDPNFALGDLVNLLKWHKPDPMCGGDAIKYYLYYAPSPNAPLALVDSSKLVNDTSFQHMLTNSIAGCYAIAAVDSYYNVGARSAVVCVDNCPEYHLPNTFTPNADGHNDAFTARLPVRYIQKVNMKIFTSWGSLVFSTSDPLINWNGIDQSTNKQAPDGTYYYVCDVYEEGSASGKPNFTLKGFIHLYR